MADVAIIGGGPAGLSAALFAAKNGLDTVIFDTDETAVHYAHLFNYLGIESMDGDDYVDTARDQVAEYGVEQVGAEVQSVESDGETFIVRAGDESTEADYVVLASGRARDLAVDLGCDRNEDGTVAMDKNARTSVDGVYAAGWIARKDKIQVAISVGDGAAAALDILSTEKGEAFHDFDTPDDAE